MKQALLSILLTLLLTGCSKDNRLSVKNKREKLIGKWELVSINANTNFYTSSITYKSDSSYDKSIDSEMGLFLYTGRWEWINDSGYDMQKFADSNPTRPIHSYIWSLSDSKMTELTQGVTIEWIKL